MKKTPARSPSLRQPGRSRGSVLLVALLLAGIIGVVLVTYLKLSNNSLKVSQRTFLQNSAMNLAEMGVERALTCFNKSVNGNTNAWDGWTINGTVATRTISGFVPAPGATGVIKLYVQNQNSGHTTTTAPDDHSWDDHGDDHSSDGHSGGSVAANFDFTSPAANALDRFAYQTRTIRRLTSLAATGLRQPSASLTSLLNAAVAGNWAGGFPVLAMASSSSDHSYSDDHHSDDHETDNHSDDDHDEPAESVSAPVSSHTILILAKAIVTPNDGSTGFTKMIEVQVAQRSTWGFGLVGRTSVSLNSNATADSWNSDPDSDPATAVVPYSAAVMRDNGTVGTPSSANGALSFGSNAAIYGTANTGGGSISYDSNVRVYGATSPASPKVDPSRVHLDFKFTFPTITVPTPTTVNYISTSVTASRTFPNGTTDLPNASDGKYYYSFAAGTVINLDSNKNLTIAADKQVVWLFQDHTGVTAIQTSSNADFVFTGTACTLEIYTNGNIRLDSNCDINSGGQPSRFKIYGTNPTSQSLVMSSNATISGVLYSPNASYSIDSNCRLFGSVVANTIHMDSQAAFHYDEALGLYGSGNPFRVTAWRELRTTAERNAYATQMNF